MRTRWTSSRCLVWGATTVDCNCGRRGRTTFKYVTGKVTMTRRVGRLSIWCMKSRLQVHDPFNSFLGEVHLARTFVDESAYPRDFLH